MRRITEEEARSILSQPKFCLDCSSWNPVQELRGAFKAVNGLVDHDKLRSGFYVELVFYRSPKTNICTYKFSVFQMSPSGSARVYQLDVRRFSKKIKDEHQRSHEHFGVSRQNGSTDWDRWDYDDVMAYFCRQTNIEFGPKLPHPEHFELKP